MIFREVYGAYYQTVARILTSAVSGQLTDGEMRRMAAENAFSESVLTILPALKEERWPLLTKDLHTPIRRIPTMPLTTIQKRWLKAISLDPRVMLFDVDFPDLENVEPLFTSEDYLIFDRYLDGDDYRDENYIRHFHTILQAVHEAMPLRIEILDRKGNLMFMKVKPDHLEYSEKDDKFRLISTGCRYAGTINLSRIISCKTCPKGNVKPERTPVRKACCLTLELIDERNALERVLLHFAHFEKRVERIDDDRYRILLYYDLADETEMLIRVLSFGPFLKVMEPESFVELIRCRLKKQIAYGKL